LKEKGDRENNESAFQLARKENITKNGDEKEDIFAILKK